MKLILALILAASPALSETCPPTPDRSADLLTLIERINAAPDARAAQTLSAQMWEIWLSAPDAAAQEVLDKGMRQRNNYDFTGALATFDRLVTYCPNYGEGYNQRAFTRFLSEDYEAALTDLDATLKLVPNHVGAQSGRALTLMNLGRLGEARLQMLAAVKNNPWLSEAALLAPGAPLGPIGDDI